MLLTYAPLFFLTEYVSGLTWVTWYLVKYCLGWSWKLMKTGNLSFCLTMSWWHNSLNQSLLCLQCKWNSNEHSTLHLPVLSIAMNNLKFPLVIFPSWGYSTISRLWPSIEKLNLVLSSIIYHRMLKTLRNEMLHFVLNLEEKITNVWFSVQKISQLLQNISVLIISVYDWWMWIPMKNVKVICPTA